MEKGGVARVEDVELVRLPVGNEHHALPLLDAGDLALEVEDHASQSFLGFHFLSGVAGAGVVVCLCGMVARRDGNEVLVLPLWLR